MAFRPPWISDKKKSTSLYDKYARNPERRAIYKDQRWTKGTRPTVLLRDLYTCRRCGGPGTEVDHIIPLERDMTDPFNPDLCQTLCRSCHNKKRKEEQ